MATDQIMRNGSHTFIGALRDAIEDWRKANGWSRETVVMLIVEAHDSIGGPVATGIEFDPPTRDAFNRAKVNADRVFRWLDDVTKDSNTCPPNFLPSILSALPLDRRMALVNHWLMPLDICCRAVDHEDGQDGLSDTVRLFKQLVASASNAQSSFANLLDGIDPGELEAAQSDLCAAKHRIETALTAVEDRMRRRP